jgi:hypothetical protein
VSPTSPEPPPVVAPPTPSSRMESRRRVTLVGKVQAALTAKIEVDQCDVPAKLRLDSPEANRVVATSRHC